MTGEKSFAEELAESRRANLAELIKNSPQFPLSEKEREWHNSHSNNPKKPTPIKSEPLFEFTPTTWNEFSKKEFSEQRWLVTDLIPQEGFVILAAPSGEKKTWIALELARCIANGINFLNESRFTTEGGNILYIDQEMSEREIHHRGKLIGLDNTVRPIWLYCKGDINFLNDDIFDEFMDFIETNNIKAVFIDTLRASAGGLNEDKAEGVRAFFDRFKLFKNKGTVIIFLDHCRKPLQNEGREPKKEQLLGSQDKTASVEILLMIRSQEGTDEIAVFQKKNRLTKEIKPFKVIMEDILDEDFKEKLTLKYGGEIEDKIFKKDEAKNCILEILSNGGRTRKEIISIVRDDRKIAPKNTSDALRELEKNQKVTVEKLGRENFYTLPSAEQTQGGDVTDDSK